jgi:hypothetical protein
VPSSVDVPTVVLPETEQNKNPRTINLDFFYLTDMNFNSDINPGKRLEKQLIAWLWL